MALTLGGAILGALLGTPHIAGVTCLVVIGILIAGWRVTRGSRLAWLHLFGFVAGVLELWSDWIHVVHFGSLVYTDYFGFQLLASPVYMPLGWWLTVVQFGYLALRLRDSWPSWKAVMVVTVLGMLIPPFDEEFAASARAWYYVPAGLMLSNTPLWIVFTYGGCMFAIATMSLVFYRPGWWGGAVLAGIFTAAAFMFFGVLSYAFLG